MRDNSRAGIPLFASIPAQRVDRLPADALEVAARAPRPGRVRHAFAPILDERALEVFARARNPDDPIELRDLWIGRVEHELGPRARRPALAEQWRATARHRAPEPDAVLSSRSTVRFVKELFNWYFRDDLYGELRSDDHLILSSGSVDEEAWGLPETLKECLRYALDRNWYGYSDSRGREPAREAVAAYESARMHGAAYRTENVALTMGGTFAISSIADFLLLGSREADSPVLCGIPNYPPLAESIARRHDIRLVPLPSYDGHTSIEPLLAALTPQTPLVLLQTAANPTGAVVPEHQLARLIGAAAPSTIVLLDECHEWLGFLRRYSAARAAPNVVRVSSLSKAWSAPGLKVGWILADEALVADYYEYASTTFGGPPSLFYTLVEVLARMERWLVTGLESPGTAEFGEFELTYGLELSRLRTAYERYRSDRIARTQALSVLRDAVANGLDGTAATIIPPRASINLALEFPEWDDSYRCFRDLLHETGVSVFPGILTFCFSGGLVRITTARRWAHLRSALMRLRERSGASPQLRDRVPLLTSTSRL